MGCPEHPQRANAKCKACVPDLFEPYKKKLERAAEALRKHGQHGNKCQLKWDGSNCDCGLWQAIEDADTPVFTHSS